MIQYPAAPANWAGSKPEWAIYWALTQSLKMVEGEDFYYQWDVYGGRTQYGGAVVDFFVPDLMVAIGVQSKFYHSQVVAQRMQDEMIRMSLEGDGVRLVYIDETDAINDPVYYTKEALAGVDHSKGG